MVSFSDPPRYYTMRKQFFCTFVKVSGERRARYKHMTNMTIGGTAVGVLEGGGFRGPVRKTPKPPLDEYGSHLYQCAESYYEYAKGLCENYNFCRNKYHLCLKEQQYIPASPLSVMNSLF